MTAIPCQLSISWWSWKGKRQISLCVSCDKVSNLMMLVGIVMPTWRPQVSESLSSRGTDSLIYFQPMHAYMVCISMHHACMNRVENGFLQLGATPNLACKWCTIFHDACHNRRHIILNCMLKEWLCRKKFKGYVWINIYLIN